MTENFFESWLRCNGWMETGKKYGHLHAVYRTYGGACVELWDDHVMFKAGPFRAKFPYEGIHVDFNGVLWLDKKVFIFPGKADLLEEEEENVTT